MIFIKRYALLLPLFFTLGLAAANLNFNQETASTEDDMIETPTSLQQPCCNPIGIFDIGTSTTVTADRPLPVPKTKPCVVNLFSNVIFGNFIPKPFSFTPPEGCHQPWAMVKLVANFSVPAVGITGRQFSRTASVWINGVNIYFGTTSTPKFVGSPDTKANSWQIEKNLTEYSALFASAQNGRVILGNFLSLTRPSAFVGSARLEFYPRKNDCKHPKSTPAVADKVLTLSNDPDGAPMGLLTPTDSLSKTFTGLPKNIVKAYLDVTVEPQNKDLAFWIGEKNYRSTEVSIDGILAGVASVFPILIVAEFNAFSGKPIPPVQTLNFIPVRVDLSPYAALLSDGNPHTISLSVFQVNNYFDTVANLVLYQDRCSTPVTGGIIKNTLMPPNPRITTVDNATLTNLERNFQIVGYVNTRKGKIITKVEQKIDYKSKVINTASLAEAHVVTHIKSKVSTVRKNKCGKSKEVWVSKDDFVWPLDVVLQIDPVTKNIIKQKTRQNYSEKKQIGYKKDGDLISVFASALSNTVRDNGEFLSNGTPVPDTLRSSQRYIYGDTKGANYNRTIYSENNILTKVINRPFPQKKNPTGPDCFDVDRIDTSLLRTKCLK